MGSGNQTSRLDYEALYYKRRTMSMWCGGRTVPNVTRACMESVYVYYETVSWKISPDREVKYFRVRQAYALQQTRRSYIASEFRQRLVLVVLLCHGEPFAEGSCYAPRSTIKYKRWNPLKFHIQFLLVINIAINSTVVSAWLLYFSADYYLW